MELSFFHYIFAINKKEDLEMRTKVVIILLLVMMTIVVFCRTNQRRKIDITTIDSETIIDTIKVSDTVFNESMLNSKIER